MSPATTQRATVQTSSGRYIDLLDPKPADILIEDIAHALSNIARFNGHTHQFYSVAQHCVLCSGINPDKLALEKLLHDATEAYVGDMVTPIKNLFPGYRTMEDKIAGVIAQAFGLNQGFHHDPEVKRSDRSCCSLKNMPCSRQTLKIRSSGPGFTRILNALVLIANYRLTRSVVNH